MITLEAIAEATERADALERSIHDRNRADLIPDLAAARERAIALRAGRDREEAAAAARTALEQKPANRRLAEEAAADLAGTGADLATAIAALTAAVHRVQEASARHARRVRHHAERLEAAGLHLDGEHLNGWPVEYGGRARGGPTAVRLPGSVHFREPTEWDGIDVALGQAFGRSPYRGIGWSSVVAEHRKRPDAALTAAPVTAPAKSASRRVS